MILLFLLVYNDLGLYSIYQKVSLRDHCEKNSVSEEFTPLFLWCDLHVTLPPLRWAQEMSDLGERAEPTERQNYSSSVIRKATSITFYPFSAERWY